MYHGYPDDTIPLSCAYKIGDAAVDTVYDVPTVIRKRGSDIQTEREKVLDKLEIHLAEVNSPFPEEGFEEGLQSAYREMNIWINNLREQGE